MWTAIGTFFDLKQDREFAAVTRPFILPTTRPDWRHHGQLPLASPYETSLPSTRPSTCVRHTAPHPRAGCYTVTLELIVPYAGNSIGPSDSCRCTQDGLFASSIRVQEDLIFGSQNPADYALTYHLTEADAIAGTPFVVQPEAFTNTVPTGQTIWVRVDDNNTDCLRLAFEYVKFFPAITEPAPLVLCDDLGEENDGIDAFDLTVRNGEITNGDLTLGVSSARLRMTLWATSTALTPAGHINQSNPQVLYVRVEGWDLVPPVFSSTLLP